MSGMAAMRSHVSVLAMFQTMLVEAPSRARVQVIIKTSGERRADSRHLSEIRHPGTHHALQPPEVLEQGAALGGAQARHDFQHRLVVAPGAFAPMAGDGEAVGLVADSLNEPQRG